MRRLLSVCLCWFGFANIAVALPVFSVNPLLPAQSQLLTNEIGTAIYQITNNTNYTLNNIVLNLPAGITQVLDAGVSYCGTSLSLASHSACLVKLRLDGNALQGSFQGGPIVCYSANRPIFCSQPLTNDQLATTSVSQSIPSSCDANVANFNYTLTQNFAANITPDPTWGPYINTFAFSPSQPDLRNCPASGGITWQQQRVLAAAAFWISKKLNYCHHHVPDWPTPVDNRGATLHQGGYCSPKIDLMPGSVYYGQAVRWNYSGQNSETLTNWQQNNFMWYGWDCSNYTAFLYDFALGIVFTGETGWQAGQAEDNSQTTLSPNQQTPGNVLANPNAAGVLVCADNTLEVSHSCAGHGGYISVINSSGGRDPNAVTDSMLEALHPGDLLFIAANLENGTPDSEVTHVVMWTGKKVGNTANDISANVIAPNSLCLQSQWQPHSGDWVITDSHYQGPDYRILSNCFYRSNIWGVRRVIY